MRRPVLFLFFVLCSTAIAAAEPTAFRVKVEGSGSPMIFIPGLTAPGEVWDPSIAHFSKRYECHRLSIAGFAGAPPIAEPLLPALKAQIVEYIRSRKLVRPVLVGHSMGGFLAFWIASSEPDLVGPVIAVDGLPFGAAILNASATAESVAPQAEALAKMIASMNQEQFDNQTRLNLAMMLTRKEDVDRIGPPSGRSDPATVAATMRDLVKTDLRAEVVKIRTPVLLIAAGALGEEGAIREKYEAQVASVPQHEVVVAKSARHYVMVDDLPFFLSTVDAFLGAKPEVRKEPPSAAP